MKYVIFICILALSFTSTWAQTDEGDDFFDRDEYFADLVRQMSHMGRDTTRLRLLETIAHDHYNADSTKKYATLEFELAEELNRLVEQAMSMRYLAWADFEQRNYADAYEKALQSVALAERAQDTLLMGRSYQMLGDCLSAINKEVEADQYYHRALDTYTQLGEYGRQCEVLRGIGHSATDNQSFTTAEKCFTEALRVDSLTENYEGIAQDLYYFGYLNYAMAGMAGGDMWETCYLNALDDLNQSLAISSNIDMNDAHIYKLKADCWLSLADRNGTTNHKAALDSCRAALNYAYMEFEQIGQSTLELDFISLRVFMKQKKFSEAKNLLTECQEFCRKHDRKSLVTVFSYWIEYYRTTGNLAKALDCTDSLDAWRRWNNDAEYASESARNLAQKEADAKMREVERAQHDREVLYQAEKDRQRIVSIALVCGLLLVTAIVIIVVRNNIKGRKINALLDSKNAQLQLQQEEVIAQNEKLAERNQQIEQQKNDLAAQKEQIEQANQQITDSIRYAKLIQTAAFPTDENMDEIFGKDKSMVLFRPLNIVSGDYYWAAKVGRLSLLAVADCTGHGVPGAFMSMLGISMLNDVPKTMSEDEPSASAVLDYMRKTLKTALKQKGGENDNHDGMDMAFIVLDRDNKQVHYAGAFRPLLLVRGGEVEVIDADRMPIGVHIVEAEHFTNHLIDVQEGDVLYMFSDGFPDQFGYNEAGAVKKFTAKRLRTLLCDEATKPFDEQKENIANTILRWRHQTEDPESACCEQVDDCLLVGIRI